MAGRDLAVYASVLGGSLSYYRDRYGSECDFVAHLPDGRYGLFECKIGSKHIEEGAAHLNELLRLIKERRAKENSVVLETYSHLVPDEKDQIANFLDETYDD